MISTSVRRTTVRHATVVGSLRLVAQTKFAPLAARMAVDRTEPAALNPARSFSATPAAFLTKSKTPSTKKKSQSPTAKKKTATAKKEKAAKSKATKAKKKRGSAKKPVKKKTKTLSPEQKAKRKETLKKKEIAERKKALKEASLIKEEPRPGLVNSYMLFTAEKRPTLQGKGLGVTDIAKQLGEDFKKLSPGEVERYQSLANSNRETYKATLEAWVKKHTPAEIMAANKARSALKRMGLPSRQHLSDDRLPSPALSAYLHFVKEQLASHTGGPVKTAMADAASKWKNLSAAQKKPYEDLAAQDKKRHEEQLEAIGA